MSFNSSSSSATGDNNSESSADEIYQVFKHEPSSPELEKISSRPIRVPVKRRNRKSYKRPSNNPVYMPSLRILRRDIRRKYCEMMNNVMNSYDPSLILNFFQDFSIPNLQRVLHYPSNTLQALHQTSIITGIEDQVKDFSKYFKLMPDVIFSITDVKVCKSSNNSGSRVVANTSMRGTLLYSARNSMESAENGHLIECDSATVSTTTTSEGVEGIDDVILDRLESPLNYEMNGILTLNLDEQHRMIMIEIQPLDSRLSSSLSNLQIN